ncbi:MAG: ABC transporter permease [Bacteroidales bacterium]|jgi:ABC-2 type transport system permease protein|nr:ABC transporter permease [Bacteroidales bacterium]
MRKFITLLYKDYLLLIRDVAGLCLMFLMPVVLVFLMTFLQNDLIGKITETEISVIMLNMDNDTLGNSIERQIANSESFILMKTESGENDLRVAVAKGDYMIGIVIPQSISDSIRQNANRAVLRGFTGEVYEKVDSVSIRIYIDPTLKISFRNTLISTMKEYTAKTERDFLIKELISELNQRIPNMLEDIQLDGNQVDFDVQYAFIDENAVIPNATQHNVPAWTLFAIFFITLSLSVSLINEKKEGSFKRLLTMPTSYFQYLLSKGIVFLFVCLLQFALLFTLGIYLFPHIGLQKLILGDNAWLLLPMCVCASLAAIGYGILIGKITTDHQQAAILAALSVVIFAAIGGIWVPVFTMPEIMKTISQISPLNWGLNGFYNILIRNGTFMDILPECAYSIGFSSICIIVALFYHRKKKM